MAIYTQQDQCLHQRYRTTAARWRTWAIFGDWEKTRNIIRRAPLQVSYTANFTWVSQCLDRSHTCSWISQLRVDLWSMERLLPCGVSTTTPSCRITEIRQPNRSPKRTTYLSLTIPGFSFTPHTIPESAPRFRYANMSSRLRMSTRNRTSAYHSLQNIQR